MSTRGTGGSRGAGGVTCHLSYQFQRMAGPLPALSSCRSYRIDANRIFITFHISRLVDPTAAIWSRLVSIATGCHRPQTDWSAWLTPTVLNGSLLPAFTLDYEINWVRLASIGPDWLQPVELSRRESGGLETPLETQNGSWAYEYFFVVFFRKSLKFVDSKWEISHVLHFYSVSWFSSVNSQEASLSIRSLPNASVN